MEMLPRPHGARVWWRRPELFLCREARPACFKNLVARIAQLLVENGTPALVYVSRVKEAEKLLAELRAHSGLSAGGHVVET